MCHCAFGVEFFMITRHYDFNKKYIIMLSRIMQLLFCHKTRIFRNPLDSDFTPEPLTC